MSDFFEKLPLELVMKIGSSAENQLTLALLSSGWNDMIWIFFHQKAEKRKTWERIKYCLFRNRLITKD